MGRKPVLPSNNSPREDVSDICKIDYLETESKDDMVDIETGTRSSTSTQKDSNNLSKFIHLFTLDILKPSDREGYEKSESLLAVKLYYIR